MSSKNNFIIEVNAIKKIFTTETGDTEILKGITAQITKGDFVLIVGPSGCGKSTLLHTLLGLEPPSSGSIIVDGNDFYSMSEDERAIFRRHYVGIIYQQPLWIESLNVIENVSFPLHLLDEKEEEINRKAHEALAMVGLDEWATYVPKELSSGQQQKISLARVLTLDPMIIVADEPTGNLDSVSGQELIDTFMRLVDKGKTVIMVTHNLEYLKFATCIFHMIDGQIVEQESVHKKKGSSLKRGQDISEDVSIRDKEFLKKVKLHT
ncbi:ABC transporter ATP-binding protein [Candidatus Roizmanbacteria bacterium]|nr:ABC transporter ATP-binding protein [Candidatus Roizmanbacteria bacterium]